MFTKSNYLIKEEFKLLKITDKYDIIDPENNEVVAYAKENIPALVKVLRLLVKKTILPTTIEIKDSKSNELLFTMKRPVTFLRSKVNILDNNGNEVGYFRSRIFTIGGRFDVFKNDGNKLAEVKGNWTGWNFTMTDASGKEVGVVTKKWAGIGKELFTTSDTYMISLNDSVKENKSITPLLIMAGLAIDVVYKEKN
jgi:uncharacterized protein YxjI